MTRKKGGLGRTHKGGTGRSKRQRIGTAGLGACHGSGRTSAVTVGETAFVTPSDDIIELPLNGGEAHDVLDAHSTSDPLVEGMPTLVPSAIQNSFFLPFLDVDSEKTDIAVFASLNMTRSEYGKLLVTMGKSKDWLPNLQSKSVLDYILVTLEFLPDDYDVLIELKNKNSNESTVQSMVSIIYFVYDEL